MIFKLIFCLFGFFMISDCNKIRGVSLGSLFVLEPFITPSLFYPFIGNNERVISDTYSFCDYLGPLEANMRLKKHWISWVNETTIKILYESGLNTIRIPVGDYMYIPYGPYAKFVDGISCFSGSLEYLDIILTYTQKYNLKVILDIHAWKDSQNGFDNSGQTKNVETFKFNNTLYFKHWNIRTANWIGDFDLNGKYYKNINRENINYAINVIETLLIRYKDTSYVWGLCPMNEPWEYTPLYELKRFYKSVYDIFVIYWPKKALILHDSFRSTLWTSCDFLDDILKVDIYLDTHQYIAWNNPISFDILINSIQNWNFPSTCFKVIVGEFSLATDNCMMWLNGFMDNLPNYPFQQCHYERCPYYNIGLNSFYLSNVKNGPYGTGISFPTVDGFCPITTPIYQNNIISTNQNNDDIYATTLFNQYKSKFEEKTEGWIFWNFQTESSSYSWNYISSYKKGYITLNYLKSESPIYFRNNFIIYIFIIIFIISIIFFYIIYIYFNKKKEYSYISIEKKPIKRISFNYTDNIINI